MFRATNFYLFLINNFSLYTVSSFALGKSAAQMTPDPSQPPTTLYIL